MDLELSSGNGELTSTQWQNGERELEVDKTFNLFI